MTKQEQKNTFLPLRQNPEPNSVLDILGIKILIVQTPASLLWTLSVGAAQLTSSRATSLPKVSHLKGSLDAN